MSGAGFAEEIRNAGEAARVRMGRLADMVDEGVVPVSDLRREVGLTANCIEADLTNWFRRYELAAQELLQ